MKKLMLIFVFVLLLVGCSARTDPVDENSEPKSEPEEIVELTGNIFLDAEINMYVPNSGSFTETICITKSDALEATAEEYSDFLTERVSKSYGEAFAIVFEDGTGVTYFGCDPANAVYGVVYTNGLPIEASGYIIPGEDGTYSYVSYSANAVEETKNNGD